MRSTTRRAFCGVTRTYRACALASIASLALYSVTFGSPAASAAAALAVVLLVAAERARRGELPQLVADHRLGDEHRDVLAAVVDREGVPEHLRDDHGATGPGADDVLGAPVVLRLHLLQKVVVDEGTLLQAPRHGAASPVSASCRYGGGGRSSCRSPCSGGGCGPRADPRGSPGGGRRRSCPRHHRAGGRPGSSRHRGRSGACPSSACGRPCPS